MTRDGWQIRALARIAELNPGPDKVEPDALATFLPMAAVEEESGRISLGEAQPYRGIRRGLRPFREGDVLFAKITPSMENGKSAVARQLHGGRGLGSTEFHVIRPGPELDSDFLRYFLVRKSLRADARHHMTGTAGQLRVPSTYLSTLLVALPPLAQQRRIVAELDDQMSRIEVASQATASARQRLRRYRDAVLTGATLGRMHREDASVAPLAEELASGRGGDGPSRLPADWRWTTFAAVAERVTVGHVGPMKHEYVERGVPFLRSQNVRPNRFDPMGLKFITRDFHSRLAKSRLLPGDVVVVRSGTVGTACVIPDELPEANCADLVIIQRPKGINPQFAAFYLNSGARHLIAAGRVGVALTHFNTRSVADLPVPLPPLEEQSEIVNEVERKLSIVGQLERELDVIERRAAAMREALITNAVGPRLNGKA